MEKPAAKAKGPKPAKAAHATKRRRVPQNQRPTLQQAPAGDKIEAVGKRDPFAPLINNKKDAWPALASWEGWLGDCHGARGRRRAFGELR